MGPPKKNPSWKPFQVNLLIRKGEQIPLYTRLIKWALSSGRFIIVMVELVTISAFVFRYKLDAELTDLKEKINERKPYVESLKADEILIRQTQFQLATIKQMKTESPEFSQVILTIAKLTPKNIRLTSISFDRSQSFSKTGLTISGITPSNIELSAFIKALQKDSNFAEISLSNVSFEGQTSFTITGVLNEKGAKSS